MYSSGNPIVDAVGKISISGNVIPQNWFKTITKEGTDKPYLLAMMILADIVYWYRPVEMRDEASGQIIGWKKKFKSDLYQRSYSSFKEQFGEEVKTIQRAINRLEDLGVIQRVFRTIELNNVKFNNVMFLELDADRLSILTFGNNIVTDGMVKNDQRYGQDCPEGVDKNDQRYGQNCPNITKNINKDYGTENISSSSDRDKQIFFDDDEIKKRIEYDRLTKEVSEQAILDILVKILCTNKKLGIHITYHSAFAVLNKIASSTKKINNIENYLCKALENELTEHNSYYVKKSKKNSFNDFPQRTYDYDMLEKQLLEKLETSGG
jgi:hypothetical protein